MKAFLLHLTCLVLTIGIAVAAARRAPPESASDQESIAIFDHRKVLVALPKGFTVSTRQDPRGLVNARIADWQDQVSIELTFLPDGEGRFADGFARKELMHEFYQQYLEGSVEKAMQFEELESKVGKGTYCVFTDKRLVGKSELPPNEYLNATTGVKSWPGVVILFTVLSNGTGTKEYRAAMTLLRESVHERMAPLR